MANGTQNFDSETGFLRKQLAVAVKSIQWSYAIFWSLSTRQQGVLEWCDGYYNGDIKTRKTIQTEDVHVDKMGLHRSEQLRELYKSLLEGEMEQQTRKPPASLSPEDLSDAEWYYLVCMSFAFHQGQGLPGRAFADSRAIWLCNAQYAESSVFSRSLLAKSASIQTVVCFPYLGGVIELGVTERVSEDPSLLQHVKDFLLKFSKPICSMKPSSVAYKDDKGKETVCGKSNEFVEVLASANRYSSMVLRCDDKGMKEIQRKNSKEFSIDSLDDCSKDCEQIHQMEDSIKLGAVNEGASHFAGLQFLYEDFSHGIQDSMNPSDCISEALINQEKAPLSSAELKCANDVPLKELQNSNHTEASALGHKTDEDKHYKKTLLTILGSSAQLVGSPLFHNFTSRSSFTQWKKGMAEGHVPQVQQKLLKKILFTVPLLSAGGSPNCPKEGEQLILKQGSKDMLMKNAMHNELRENEQFIELKSMLPSLKEIDKVSILNDTIEYLKMLESRVQELEACMDSLYYEERFRRKYLDILEQTSDNYDYERIEDTFKKPSINKRKACEIDGTSLKLKNVSPKDGSKVDVEVTMKDQEVLIDMQCPYREYILVDVMDTVNNLQLHAYSVQSSDCNGVFSLTLKSKFQGMDATSVGMIRFALLKIANKC